MNKSILCAVAVLGFALSASALADDHETATTFDGLVPLEGASMGVAYIDPNADFGVFNRVAVFEPHVAFRSNWKRDQNRSRSRNIRASDVERIKENVADLFVEVFTERLEAAGHDVVNYADEDVMILRPAIIDLDISAPDVRSAGRTRNYVTNAGAATLFVEMHDSLTGDLLGRAIDRRAARRGGGFAISANRVTNRSDARREFRVWADALIELIDQHYIEADDGAD